jgi:peptide/nickel transport system substrate-binding protein
MSRRRATSALLATVLAVLALGAACARRGRPAPQPDGEAERPRAGRPLPGGEVVLALEEEPEHLNFHVNHHETILKLTYGSVYEPLVQRDPWRPAPWDGLTATPAPTDGVPAAEQPVPGRFRGVLARSWHFEEGGRVLVLDLREGVRWHDGEPFSSTDVVNTLALVRQSHYQSPMAAELAGLETVEAPGPRTVRLRFREPAAHALDHLESLPILPAHVFRPGSSLRYHNANNSPTGTGPYSFQRWARGHELVFRRFPEHWAGRATADEVRQRFTFVSYRGDRTAQLEQRIKELQSGEIDVVGQVPPLLAAKLSPETLKVARLHRWRGPRLRAYLFNVSRRQLSDGRVRRALSYLVDGPKLVREGFGGQGQMTASPLWSALPGHDPTLMPHPYDLRRAEQELLEAFSLPPRKGPPPAERVKRLTMLLPRSDSAQKEGEVLREAFARAGIELSLYPLDDRYLRIRVERGDFDIAAVDLWMRQSHLLAGFLRSNSRNNVTRYYRPEVDRLLDEWATTFSTPAQVALERRLAALLQQDPPWLALVAQPELVLVRKGVRGFSETELGVPLAGLWRGDLVPDLFRRLAGSLSRR